MEFWQQPAERKGGGLCDYRLRHGRGSHAGLQLIPGRDLRPCEDALDAYTFAQINDGNAIAIPFAKGFGWGGDLNLEYIFEKLFCEPSGQGYPRERAVPEQRNKRILDDVRKASFREDLVEIFKGLDQELVKGAFQEKSSGNCSLENVKMRSWPLISGN